VSCIQSDHKFTNTTEDTCAVALQGGCDLDCGGLLSQCAAAVGNGTRGLGEADVETALVRIFSQRIATGEFEPTVEEVSYRRLGLEHFNTSAAQKLALDTALQSIVLMKNVDQTLPIELATLENVDADATSGSESAPKLNLLVAGPNLNNDMLGDYHGTPAVHITFADGLKAYEATHAVNITTLPGCAVNSPDTSGIAAVVAAAKTADVVVLFLGLDGSIENEGQDRPIAVGLGLPGQQENLLSSVAGESIVHRAVCGTLRSCP